MVLLKHIFALVIVILSSTQVRAQKICADSFDEISRECIERYDSKLKRIKFVLPAKAEKIKDQTFFFKTENGHPGKFIIRSLKRTSKECTIYLDVVSYNKQKLHTPNGTFSIRNEYSSWGSDKAGFDDVSTSDFELIRTKGRCVFRSVNATAKFYKKTKEQKIIESNDLLLTAGLFLVGLAVFLVARTVFQDEDKFKAQEKLEDADVEDKQNVPNDIVLKYSRPFFKRYFSPIVSGMKNKKKIKEKYKRKLASSGMNKHLTPEDFYAFKLFLIIGFPLVFLGLREFLEEEWSLIYMPMVSIFGFFYPDIWIDGKISIRKKEIINGMPFVVDMLALSVEAGLDFVAAMQKVIEKAPPSALTEEFETMIKETKIGASRAEGLRQMSWRINELSVSSFCATLIAADAVGASIGPILKTLAVELRQKRSAAAEKAGAQAATKIIFPMIMFILPSVALIIAAPIAMELLGVK